jgi:hypothetical protein
MARDKDNISLNDPNPFVVDDKLKKIAARNQVPPDAQEKLEAFQKDIERLNDPNMPYNEKLDLIIELKTRIVPLVFKELYASFPNPEISLIASRASFALKEAAAIIIKKRESEVSDEINPFSPKFQKAFYWLIELFHQTLVENGCDEITVNNVFSTLSSKLLGWEEIIAKQLKSISSKALEKVENPFIAKFKEELKESPQEEPSLKLEMPKEPLKIDFPEEEDNNA